LGSGIFNLTMGRLTTPAEMAAAIQAVAPGAKVKFDAPASAAVALTNRSEHADLARAKRHLGYEPQFPLQAAVKDLAEWMRRHMD
jgi:nucleoside-diphosphate-sugar epimerase